VAVRLNEIFDLTEFDIASVDCSKILTGTGHLGAKVQHLEKWGSAFIRTQEKAAHGHVVHAVQEVPFWVPFDAVFDTSCPGNERCAVDPRPTPTSRCQASHTHWA
jgi:hypothetical protein